MRAVAWRDYLEDQRARHRKVLFTVTELANVGGVSAAALNVELARLRAQKILVRYAHGLYGLAGALSLQELLPAIDSHAYLTGHYALLCHQMVTQVPTVVTCFTDRRSPRAQVRSTPLGRLVFVCVRSAVFSPPPQGSLASPAQALCDYIYLTRRRGAEAESLVTFGNLARIPAADMSEVLSRYPISVKRNVERLLRPEQASSTMTPGASAL